MDAFCGVFAQPDPMARLCRLRGWREKEAEPGSGLRVLHGGLLQPLQQDGPVACHGAGDVEFHAPCVPDHAAARAQNLFAEGAEAPAFPGGVLHRAAALVHGLIGEQGEQEKGFVLRPPLRFRGRVGPLDRLAGILALRPRRGRQLRPQRALQFAEGVLRLSAHPVPGQELLRSDIFAGQARDQPEMAREQLPLRENHDKGHAPLAVPVPGLVLVLMKDRTHFARRQVRRLVQMRFRHPVQYRIVPDTGQILETCSRI